MTAKYSSGGGYVRSITPDDKTSSRTRGNTAQILAWIPIEDSYWFIIALTLPSSSSFRPTLLRFRTGGVKAAIIISACPNF